MFSKAWLKVPERVILNAQTTNHISLPQYRPEDELIMMMMMIILNALDHQVDRLEDELVAEQEKYKAITEELEMTFAEMSGY